MSFLNTVFRFALANIQNQAQQVALNALQDAAQQATSAILKHTPDVSKEALRHLETGMAIAVAGASNKTVP